MADKTILMVGSKMCSACARAKEVLPEIAEKLGADLMIVDIEQSKIMSNMIASGKLPSSVPQIYVVKEGKAKLAAIGVPKETSKLEEALRKAMGDEQ